MNHLTKIGFCIFGGLVFFIFAVSACKKDQPASTEVIAQEYAKGLDLQLVAAMAKKSKDATSFEKELNSSSSKVNNIDLNDDGKVDYIKVTEYGSDDKRGFSLTTEMEPGKVQEIATIQFTKNGENVDMDVRGNQTLYGNGHHYRSSFSITDGLLLYWIFSSRNHYHSPYGYGHYPSHYNSNRSRISNTNYGKYTSTQSSRSSFKKASGSSSSTSLKSPNANKSAVRANIIANPTKSQRSFQKRSGTSARSGGFGKTSSSSTRSGSSFGGGK